MNTQDKPEAARLGWRLQSTRYLYRSRWFDLRQDEVALPQGRSIAYTYVEHPGFVSIVPVTPEGAIVLIRVYRYTMDRWLWEVPAGGLGGRQGQDPAAAAREELTEETGYEPRGELLALGRFYSGVGNTNTPCFVYLAMDVVRTRAQALEDTEAIEVHPVPLDRALAMARDGSIADEHSALALLLAEPHLRVRRPAAGRGPRDASAG